MSRDTCRSLTPKPFWLILTHFSFFWLIFSLFDSFLVCLEIFGAFWSLFEYLNANCGLGPRAPRRGRHTWRLGVRSGAWSGFVSNIQYQIFKIQFFSSFIFLFLSPFSLFFIFRFFLFFVLKIRRKLKNLMNFKIQNKFEYQFFLSKITTMKKKNLQKISAISHDLKFESSNLILIVT